MRRKFNSLIFISFCYGLLLTLCQPTSLVWASDPSCIIALTVEEGSPQVEEKPLRQQIADLETSLFFPETNYLLTSTRASQALVDFLFEDGLREDAYDLSYAHYKYATSLFSLSATTYGSSWVVDKHLKYAADFVAIIANFTKAFAEFRRQHPELLNISNRYLLTGREKKFIEAWAEQIVVELSDNYSHIKLMANRSTHASVQESWSEIGAIDYTPEELEMITEPRSLDEILDSVGHRGFEHRTSWKGLFGILRSKFILPKPEITDQTDSVFPTDYDFPYIFAGSINAKLRGKKTYLKDFEVIIVLPNEIVKDRSFMWFKGRNYGGTVLAARQGSISLEVLFPQGGYISAEELAQLSENEILFSERISTKWIQELWVPSGRKADLLRALKRTGAFFPEQKIIEKSSY